MEKEIVILRGINVGGKRKILMADLKALFQRMGFLDVKTYIQSGNVIFSTSTKESSVALSARIEKEIEHRFGFEVPVIARKASELKNAVDNNPFYTENSDISSLYLTFLSEIPTFNNRVQTEECNAAPDKFSIADRHIFVYCEGKYHQSKLTNNFFEKKLKVNATTRNWKTVLKLLELSEEN